MKAGYAAPFSEGPRLISGDVYTSGGIGRFADGLEYGIAAGPVYRNNHLSDSENAALLARYSGKIMVDSPEPGGNCPFPQFLPDQAFIQPSGVTFLDPHNVGAIQLTGPLVGNIVAYKYIHSDGTPDPTIHHFNIYTGQFS